MKTLDVLLSVDLDADTYCVHVRVKGEDVYTIQRTIPTFETLLGLIEGSMTKNESVFGELLIMPRDFYEALFAECFRNVGAS